MQLLGVFLLACCLVLIAGSSPTGYDVSQQISNSSASCFESEGAKIVIPRGYCSTCEVDDVVCDSLMSAKNAGIKTRDVYMFPAPKCSRSAKQQLQDLINFLKGGCYDAWSGRVWLDIEGSQYWLGDCKKLRCCYVMISYTATFYTPSHCFDQYFPHPIHNFLLILSLATSNRDWYQSLVDSCSDFGISCGVYSSSSQWSAIMGSTSYCYGSKLPLWYSYPA